MIFSGLLLAPWRSPWLIFLCTSSGSQNSALHKRGSINSHVLVLHNIISSGLVSARTFLKPPSSARFPLTRGVWPSNSRFSPVLLDQDTTPLAKSHSRKRGCGPPLAQFPGTWGLSKLHLYYVHQVVGPWLWPCCWKEMKARCDASSVSAWLRCLPDVLSRIHAGRGQISTGQICLLTRAQKGFTTLTQGLWSAGFWGMIHSEW